jgi:phosphatidylserine decarboxylase
MKAVLIFLIILLIFLLYQSDRTIGKYEADNNTIICPCDGIIVDLHEDNINYYISIFMRVYDRHYQIYPVNGTVIKRVFDNTGKYEVAYDLGKSRYNEKKIHAILMNNGGIMQITQISGFLARMIDSGNALGTYKAGDYLGEIKFGSRVDLVLPKQVKNKTLNLKVKHKDVVQIGRLFGVYQFV